MIDREKIRRLRQTTSFSPSELSARLGSANLNYVYRVERGESSPSTDFIERLAKALECSPLEFIEDKYLPREGKPIIPIVGFVSAGESNVPVYDDGDYPVGVGMVGEIDVSRIPDDNAYAVEVRGDSMYPLYRDKDILVVTPNLKWQPRTPCLVRAVDGRVWVKRVMEDAGFLTLVSDNSQYPPIPLMKDQVAYVHRVYMAISR